jgi:hypothetical protein
MSSHTPYHTKKTIILNETTVSIPTPKKEDQPAKVEDQPAKVEDQPVKVENQPDIVPHAFLFEKKVVGINEITIAEKYILVYAFHVNEPHINVFKLDLETIDRESKRIDFLTFNWKDIPKQVFINIFSRLSFTRLLVFCAHFHIHLPSLDEKHVNVQDLVLSLWNKFMKM